MNTRKENHKIKKAVKEELKDTKEVTKISLTQDKGTASHWKNLTIYTNLEAPRGNNFRQPVGSEKEKKLSRIKEIRKKAENKAIEKWKEIKENIPEFDMGRGITSPCINIKTRFKKQA